MPSHLLPFALVFLGLASAPAYAGRASACKEPPFAVPRETQRAVDAAIEARVTGTGAGALSSNVETRTGYDTTTLSQDAAATAWTQYTLCMKLAKKLISQELHDELLRSLVAPQTVATVAPAPTTPTPAEPTPAAPPSDPSLIVGTWQVTSRFDWMSCPSSVEAGTDAYLWLVSLAPSGEIVVRVEGRTTFDELRGSWSDGRLRAGGVRQQDSQPVAGALGTTTEGQPLAALPRADIDVRLVGDELVGQRLVATGATQPAEAGASALYLPCTVVYELRARR